MTKIDLLNSNIFFFNQAVNMIFFHSEIGILNLWVDGKLLLFSGPSPQQMRDEDNFQAGLKSNRRSFPPW